MKKTVLVITLALLCAATAFAWQDNYTQASDEVQAFYTLRRISGTSTADPTFPISASQLLSLVERLDSSRFGAEATKLYDELVSKLTAPEVLNRKDDLGFDFKSIVEVFGIHSSDSVDELYYPYWNRPDAVSLEVTLLVTPSFTGFINLNLGPTYRYSQLFGNNIEGIVTMARSCGFGDSDGTNGFNVNIPDRAYGSFGNDSFNLTVGRDRISEGNGFTGNLTLGDNFIYDDFIKASFVSGAFSYDLTLITYDNAVNEDLRFKNDRKNVVNHRFSVSFCKYLTATITEGAMIYTDDLFSDPRLLNPFMMIHDMFTFLGGDTNNYFSAEATASLPFGIQVDGQYYFDQIRASFESEETGRTAYAALLNASWTDEIGPGILTAYAEFASVSPCCYLKENRPGWNSDEWLGRYEDLDLIMEVSNTWYYCYNTAALGYTYGPDCTVFGAGASYLWNGIDFNLDALYVRKGTHGFGTNEQRACDLPAEEGMVDTSLFRLSLDASGTVHDGIVGFDLGFGFDIIKNRDHLASNGTEFAPVFKLALMFDPMSFLSRKAM